MTDITREQYDNAARIRDCGYENDGVRQEVEYAISTYEAAHPEEFRKTPDPGEGWRWLDLDKDKLQEGDEVGGIGYFETVPESSWGQGVHIFNKFRRRIAKAPRIYDYRDIDLPEVQALIGKQVYASDVLAYINNDPRSRWTFYGIKAMNHPFSAGGVDWQFIRAIDEPTKIKLTRAELIAIAAEHKGVKPEQIVVEEWR